MQTRLWPMICDTCHDINVPCVLCPRNSRCHGDWLDTAAAATRECCYSLRHTSYWLLMDDS